MAGSGPLGVAIVGCGNISRGYARTMAAHPNEIRLVGCFDIQPQAAQALAAEFPCRVYKNLIELTKDAAVEAVVNLTIHDAHVNVTTACLKAGKHVHSEKPLAMDARSAARMAALAKKKKVRLSAAPITFMGECQQTAWKMIRENKLGTVRVAYAEMNWGRIENWHPNPAPFYKVGALFDIGVYPLTVLTTILGPVKRVMGFGKVVWPDRTSKSGQKFRLKTPDWMCGYLEFASGPIARLTASFYVGPTKQHGIEFHGDTATLHLSTAHDFNGKVQLRMFGSNDWIEQPLAKAPYPGVEWARGLTELHNAIRTDRPHRASAEQAVHVVEIVEGIYKAARRGRPVAIKSKFKAPAPMDWAM
jgi:predicted dehydrogenase